MTIRFFFNGIIRKIFIDIINGDVSGGGRRGGFVGGGSVFGEGVCCDRSVNDGNVGDYGVSCGGISNIIYGKFVIFLRNLNEMFKKQPKFSKYQNSYTFDFHAIV